MQTHFKLFPTQLCVNVLTKCIVQVLLSHQFEVLLDGFSGQRVLPKDEHVMVGTSVHLRHNQVCQEVLREEGRKERGGGERR